MTERDRKTLLQRAQTILAKQITKSLAQIRAAQAEVDRLKGTK